MFVCMFIWIYNIEKAQNLVQKPHIYTTICAQIIVDMKLVEHAS